MPDREKVIQELEAMRNYHRSIGNNISADIAEDAIALLKCLEPVRPVRKKEIGAYHSLYCVCGNCGAWLLDGQKFCDECGRKVKWDAVD